MISEFEDFKKYEFHEIIQNLICTYTVIPYIIQNHKQCKQYKA
jgi:hypothetical protein